MSEVQSRPAAPRGRGSARGGRGGFSARGGRGSRGHATNGDKTDSTSAPIEDDGEVGQLKKKFGSKVTTIKEMFPDWTDEDVVFALQETDGDLETTVDRITDGTITQWGEVSKGKKDRSKSKVKEATTVTSFGDSTNQARVSRGGRAGFDGARGGRGRATERGGRGGRGRAPTNGVRKENVVETSTPTVESTAWETAPQGESSWETPKATEDSLETTKPAQEGWGSTASGAAAATATAAAKVTSSVIPDGVKKSWASIFAPAPTPKKAPEPVVEKPTEPVKVEEPVETAAPEPEPSIPEPAPVEPIEPATVEAASAPEPEVQITPSNDELTEDNLEQLPDTSAPAPTATAASTAASSWDSRSAAATPYSNLQSTPQAIRPPTSGFQASALKATGSSTRTPSYQRRVLDQEEAVRMPGNREVERTAVQFGAFNLNGSGEEDVDGDREEAETRAQPPQHSPVAPRAALPPAPQPAAVPESLPTPKQPAGLPAATHPTAAPGLPSPAPHSSAQVTAQQGPQGNGQYSQYGRYGQAGVQESSLPPKPYDAFSQQAPSTQSPFEGYPSQPSQSQSQPQSGAFSSAPNEFSSYYTADPQQQRNAYNSYYQQQYGQQQGSQGQDGPASQQRGYPGYNGPQAENTSQFPQSGAQTTQSRYATAGEGQNSGHTTPNPVAQSQQPAASQGAQPQPGHQQQPQVGNYPYGHPYYQSPYYAAAWNQYQQGYGGNYPGGPYGAKGSHQPYQGYGMSPAAPYEHTASPAAGGFGGSSLHGRESALGGLSEYGRAGSSQASQTPQALGGSGGFGGHDAFGRGSSYQGQGQQHYNSQQGAQPGASDDLKPFGDSKAANGPSPSLQAGRPGSATNASSGSALPPTQTQAGYGGYPAHLQQPGQGLHANQAGSGYGGLGGAGHQAGGQGHQNSQYGAYQAFGGNYGGYGNSQQRGGWGGHF